MQPTIRKNQLLGILEENRLRHREVFLAAAEGFSQEAKHQLQKWLALVKDGSQRSICIQLEAPRDHTADYDRAIKMVRLHTGDEIRLTEQDVACYIQDDWGWKRSWLANSTAYAAAAVQEYYDDDVDNRF